MMPKQSEIEVELLRAIVQLGGRAKPKDLYPLVTTAFKQLTPADLSEKLTTGGNKWTNRIQWVRQKLISTRDLESPERSVWQITSHGRSRLQNEIVSPSREPATSVSVQPINNIERLLLTSSHEVRAEVRLRSGTVDKSDVGLENAVWKLVSTLRPDAISVGRDPEILLSSGRIFRPDVIARFAGCRLLIVECKNTTSDAFIASWTSQLRNAKRDLEQALKASSLTQLIYVLVVEDRASLKEHTRNDAEQLRIKILDRREVDYFLNLEHNAGIGVEHLFWARTAPWLVRQEEKKVPALRILISRRREAYIFSINAHDLLSRAFISHRELHSPEDGQIGFQRMLQRKKLEEIASYIQRFKVFPTPIIVSFVRPNAAIFEPLGLKERTTASLKHHVEFGQLRLPKDATSIQIIDGQHRLYGYSKVPRDDEHIVQVVAYKATSTLSPASMFVDINSKQTRVSSGLLWELYPDIYGEDDPNLYKAVISRVIEKAVKNRLPESVHHITSGMSGEISFHTLCAEIKRTGLYGRQASILKSEADLAVIIECFLTTLNDLGAQYPDVNRGFAFCNSGIAPLIRTMGRVVRYEVQRERGANLKRKALLLETFRHYFEPLYKYLQELGLDRLLQLRKERVGNSGTNLYEDEFTEQIRLHYLRDFPYRSKRIPPEWNDCIEQFIASVQRVNREVIENGKMNNWVFKEFDEERTRKQLSKPITTQDNFATVLKVLYQEIIEGSGKDASDNRLALLLNIPKIYDLEIVRDLNLLRTYSEHKLEQVDARKRQQAIQALASLCNRPDLRGLSELTPGDYQQAATRLVTGITDQVLLPALQSVRGSTASVTAAASSAR